MTAEIGEMLGLASFPIFITAVYVYCSVAGRKSAHKNIKKAEELLDNGKFGDAYKIASLLRGSSFISNLDRKHANLICSSVKRQLEPIILDEISETIALNKNMLAVSFGSGTISVVDDLVNLYSLSPTYNTYFGKD